MDPQAVTPDDAQRALSAVDTARDHVRGEVGLPTWYWWGLAVGWALLGVLGDIAAPWVTTVGTFLFGSVHAAIVPRVANGRHRTAQLSVRREVAGPTIQRTLIVGLLGMVAFTVAAAMVLEADGARHPCSLAGIMAAVLILLGGPRLIEHVRPSA